LSGFSILSCLNFQSCKSSSKEKDRTRVIFNFKAIVTIIFLFLVPMAAVAFQDLAATQNRQHTFDIPAQAANITLGLIARKSNTPLLLSFNKVKLVTANKVKGVFSVDQALIAALADTRLIAFINDEGVITVKVVDLTHVTMGTKQ